MPLLDHFHGPLYPTHRWESLHARWAVAIADALNETLPARFFAETQVHLGARIEADVVEFEQNSHANGTSSALATATVTPPALFTFPFALQDDITVEIRDRDRDARLAAAIELISPGNKDREEARRGLAAKVVSYLRTGVGVMAIDIVTSRSGIPHNEVASILKLPANYLVASESGLSAASYRPVQSGDDVEIELWFEPLTLGSPLPTLPLAVRGYGPVFLDLEASYNEACMRSRLV